MKSWNQFKKLPVRNDYHALYDFKELIISKIKIVRCDQE